MVGELEDAHAGCEDLLRGGFWWCGPGAGVEAAGRGLGGDGVDVDGGGGEEETLHWVGHCLAGVLCGWMWLYGYARYAGRLCPDLEGAGCK